MRLKCPNCYCDFELQVRVEKADADFKAASATSSGSQIPRASQNGRQSSNGVSLAQLLDQIQDDSLIGAAKDFVMKTRERFEQYGERTRMSEKQLSWLKDIADGKSGRADDWS